MLIPLFGKPRAAIPFAGGFTPTDLAGLSLWLSSAGPYWQDAARTTPAASSTQPVRVWDDASGDGNHVTASSDTMRPLLFAGVNSKIIPDFDGANDGFNVVLSIAQPLWAFVAIDVQSVVGTRQFLDSSSRVLYGTTGAQFRMYAGSTILTGGVAATGLQVVAAKWDGANSKLYKNGGAAIVTGNPGAAATGANVFIGHNGASSETTSGKMYEHIIVSGAMTDAEVNNVGSFMAGIIGTTWTPIA